MVAGAGDGDVLAAEGDGVVTDDGDVAAGGGGDGEVHCTRRAPATASVTMRQLRSGDAPSPLELSESAAARGGFVRLVQIWPRYLQFRVFVLDGWHPEAYEASRDSACLGVHVGRRVRERS